MATKPTWVSHPVLAGGSRTGVTEIIGFAGCNLHSCDMATDRMRAFAEQVMKVEGVLQQSGITANPGRVIFVLTMANTKSGVSQKEVVEATALKKDIISKLVNSLVKARVLTRKRESKTNTLSTTDSGRKLLSRVNVSLRSTRRNAPEGTEKEKEGLSFFDKDGNIVAISQL